MGRRALLPPTRWASWRMTPDGAAAGADGTGAARASAAVDADEAAGMRVEPPMERPRASPCAT
eukprot:243788-Prymnesium_polylepis.1